MKNELKKILSYFFVGGIAAVIEWVMFGISNIFLNYTISTVIAFIVATTANYLLGNLLTFKNYEHSKKYLIGVFIVSGIGLLFNILFMYFFVEIMKIKYELLAKIMSTGFVFIWNYISRRIFIYKKES